MDGSRLLRLCASAFLVLAMFAGGGAIAAAQNVVTTIPVGASPNNLAVNPVTNRVYVANEGGNSVSVIDGATNAVIATIPLGHGAVNVAVNPVTNRIYVATFDQNVSVIDGATNTVIATIPVGKEPSRIVVNPTTNRIYLTNFEGDTVSAIDGASNRVVATISVGHHPTVLGVNQTTNRIYVANNGGNSVTVIDGSNNSVITTIGVQRAPLGVAVNPATNRIYIANNGAASVSVIDGASNAVIATIPVGNSPLAIAANPSTNLIYVGNFNSNSVSVIDGSTNAVTATIPVGKGPTSMSINSALNHIYTANQLSDSASILDGTDNSVISTLDIGKTPVTIRANSATNQVYALNEHGNSVSVINDPTPVSPPPPLSGLAATWYFAEGSTQPPFDTWFLVQNPGSATATVRFTFQLQGGGVVNRQFSVGPTSRFSLFANQVIPNVAFSTRIDADQPVFAERSMFVGFDGDDVTGIASPNRTWLFAEGSTQSPFQTWLLLENPNDVTAHATITYLLLGGGTPVTQTLALAPNSRTSVFVNQVLPNTAFSSRVDSDQPIVAERSMFRFPGNAATDNPGVNSPSATWYFADGDTTGGNEPFDSWLLLQNPNSTAATATITLYRDNGTVQTFTQGLAPSSRQSIYLNQVLTGARFGIQVNATQPIIAERSEFFGPEPRGAISTQGATKLATTWYLAEGSTQPPFREVIAILNPGASTMTAHIDFQLANGQVIGRDFSIGATREFRLNVADVLPNQAVSAKITTSQPSVVERLMFFRKLGSLGGTDTIGIMG